MNDKVNMKKERKRKVMQMKAILIISAVMLIMTVIIIMSVTASGSEERKEKMYRSIMIEQGDTLWDIAEKYCDTDIDTLQAYVEEIKSINGMEGDTIRSGSYLVISYYKSDNN